MPVHESKRRRYSIQDHIATDLSVMMEGRTASRPIITEAVMLASKRLINDELIRDDVWREEEVDFGELIGTVDYRFTYEVHNYGNRASSARPAEGPEVDINGAKVVGMVLFDGNGQQVAKVPPESPGDDLDRRTIGELTRVALDHFQRIKPQVAEAVAATVGDGSDAGFTD